MTDIYGLIGDPVAHSRSPAMQNAAFAALGIDATYQLWQTTSAELPARIASLRQLPNCGANVTIPHKLAVMPLLDRIAPSAELVGAVNTITVSGSSLIGHNTDASGLLQALQATNGVAPRVGLVLGAGGAARAACVALAQWGVSEIRIVARNPLAAAQLAQMMTTRLHVLCQSGSTDTVSQAELVALVADVGVIINATPIGLHDTTEQPFPLDIVLKAGSKPFLVDLITHTTHWLTTGKAHGLATMGGLPMLVYQGELAFFLWTGQMPPPQLMHQAITKHNNTVQ